MIAPIIMSPMFVAMLRKKHRKLSKDSKLGLSLTLIFLRVKWARDDDSGAFCKGFTIRKMMIWVKMRDKPIAIKMVENLLVIAFSS